MLMLVRWINFSLASSRNTVSFHNHRFASTSCVLSSVLQDGRTCFDMWFDVQMEVYCFGTTKKQNNFNCRN